MTTPEPLAFPTDPAGWTAFATERPTAAVAVVADVDARLVAGTDLDAAARLELWNDAEIALLAATNESYLLSEAHPDAAVRAIAEEQVQRLEALSASRLLDRDLFQAMAAADAAATPPPQPSTTSSGACSRRCSRISAAAASIFPTPSANACASSPTATRS